MRPAQGAPDKEPRDHVTIAPGLPRRGNRRDGLSNEGDLVRGKLSLSALPLYAAARPGRAGGGQRASSNDDENQGAHVSRERAGWGRSVARVGRGGDRLDACLMMP